MAHTPLLTCEILDEPHVDDKIKALGKDTQSAPTVVLVKDLDTDEQALLVVNTIIMSAFERSGLPVKGKVFQFRAGTIREGKTYRDIDVTEMKYEENG